ncbi:MAG: hypothetical protein ACRDU4_01250 [Mycobacterium sp.]
MRKLVLLTSVAAVLAACTSGHHGSTSPLSALKVHVGLFGGPALSDGGMADSDAPQFDASVTVVNGAGRSWTAKTGRDGVASFSVLPGKYSVTSPSCGPGPQSITVKAGQRALVQVRCAIP